MFTKWEPNYRLVKCSSSNFQLEKQGFWFLVSRPFLAWKGPFFRRQSMCLSARLSDLRRRTFFPLGKAGAVYFFFSGSHMCKVIRSFFHSRQTVHRKPKCLSMPALCFWHSLSNVLGGIKVNYNFWTSQSENRTKMIWPLCREQLWKTCPLDICT